MPVLYHNGLMNAYKGKYEDEIIAEWNGALDDDGGRAFEHDWVIQKIGSHSNLERLEVYCEWNGIIGYASTLYHMAHDGGYISG